MVVQLVRIPACHAGGRGFEPRPLRHKKNKGIILVVENNGNLNASNVEVILYKLLEDESYEEIGQGIIPQIDSDDEEEISFYYTPNESGWNQLFVVSSVANEAYPENNQDYGNVYVYEGSVDVYGEIWYTDFYAIENEPSEVILSIENLGLSNAEDITIILYDNYLESEIEHEDLIFSSSIDELLFNEMMYEYATWSPSVEGVHTLRLVVNQSEDADLSNNEYNESIEVYSRRNVSFNIQNASGTTLSRYVTIDGERFFVDESSWEFETISVESADVSLENIYYDLDSMISSSTMFIGSELNDEMNVTTELYKWVYDSADNISLNFVYANRYFYIFNEHAPYERNKGCLLKYKSRTGVLTDYAPSGMFKDVRASCFINDKILFIQGNSGIYLNSGDLGIYRYMAVDNLDYGRTNTLTTYALWAYSNAVYSLRSRYVFYSGGVWNYEDWFPKYNYVTSSTDPTVFFINVVAEPNMIHSVVAWRTSLASF